MTTLLRVLALLLLLASSAWAQQAPTPTQQVGTELRSSTVCQEVRGTGAQTLTVPAIAGKVFYVNAIEINAAATGGAAATLGTAGHVSTTGLAGSPTFGFIAAQGQAAGALIVNLFYPYGEPVKGTASTAITLVAPSITNVGWHLNICGYYDAQ